VSEVDEAGEVDAGEPVMTVEGGDGGEGAEGDREVFWRGERRAVEEGEGEE